MATIDPCASFTISYRPCGNDCGARHSDAQARFHTLASSAVASKSRASSGDHDGRGAVSTRWAAGLRGWKIRSSGAQPSRAGSRRL